MSAEGKEVAVDVLHVNGKVRSALCTVDHDGNTVLMGYAHNLLNRIYSSEDIAYMRNADYLSALSKQLFVFVEQQSPLSFIGITRSDMPLRAA